MQDFILSVAEILGRPGEYRDLTLTRPLPGAGTALARLDDDAIAADLRVESVIEGVLVTGRVSGDTVLECARCLKDYSSELSVRVCELCVGPGHEAAGEDDVYRVAGTEIDLEPLLRDATVLALPLNPLCSQDCKGLCGHCGKDLNEGPCDYTEDDIDPRWAALAELRARLEEQPRI